MGTVHCDDESPPYFQLCRQLSGNYTAVTSGTLEQLTWCYLAKSTILGKGKV